MRIALIAASVILLSAGVASAQTNPRPYIADISPRAVAPGAAGFTLTVRGTGMIDGVSQIYWNGAPLAGTTCIAAASPNMASCTATVPASSVAVPGRAAKITVVNASVTTPLISNMVPLPINVPVRPAFCYEGDSNCPGRRVDVNSNPQRVATGDFNGDGRTDVAIFYSSSSTVSLKFGNGNGQFTDGPPLQSTNPISEIAAADFDEDGIVDIAVIGGGRFAFFHGNGDGTFTETSAGAGVAYGNSLKGFVAADFNGDGHLDLATLAIWSTNVLSIQLILGDGHGGFAKAGTFGTFQIPAPNLLEAAMVAGDFDSDGVLDILTVFNPGTAFLARGDGSGGFTAGWTSTFGNNVLGDQVDTGDLNGDGHLDFAVVNRLDNVFKVFMGDGQGNFSMNPASPLTNGLTATRGLKIIDVDGDGNNDLASIGKGPFGNDYFLNAFYGDGAGGFTYASVYEHMLPYTTDVALTDLNGDGRLDLVSSATFTDGRGWFTTLLQYPISSMSPSSIDFGVQRYLTPSAPRTVTVSAGGTAPLTLSTIDTDLADFHVTGGTCAVGVPIAPGSQCTIEVTFTPTKAFSRYGALFVIGNAYQRPGGVAHQTLVAGYDDPRAEQTYSGLGQVVIGEEQILPVVLKNTGLGPFNLTFEFSYEAAIGRRSLDSGNCPVSPALLVPDASCTYNVHMTVAKSGAFAWDWAVWDNPPDRQRYPLTGLATGTAYSGAALVSPATLPFGTQGINMTSASRSVTLTNTGTSPLYIYSITALSYPRDFAIANTSTCSSGGAPLAAGSSCRVDVTYTPSTKGLNVGELDFETSMLGLWSSVELSGEGLANPRPFITAPLSPSSITPGSASGVPLVVRGAGFVAGAVVRFNGMALTTAFVDKTQLQATIPAALVAAARTARVTAFNPSPGGGESNPVDLPIATAVDAPSFLRDDITVGIAPEAIATGDFNSDGYPDIAVSTCGSDRFNDRPCGSAEVAILLGMSTSGFGEPTLVPVLGATADGIVSGDFTGDGKLDLVVSHLVPGTATLLKGDGTGNFAPSSDSPLPLGWSGACSIGRLSSGDFNGDGRLDLVALDPLCGQIFVFPGLAGTIDGNFIGYANSGDNVDMAVGDFNGDGELDIAAPMTNYGLFITTGDGTGNLNWVDPIEGLSGSGGFAAADFNGDGASDLAIADMDNASVRVFLGDGAAGFSQAGSFSAGTAPRSMTVADVNNDGAIDLLVANADDGTVTILLGNGAGQLAPAGPAESVFSRPVAVATVDVDGDGRLDVITVNRNDWTISVLRQENPAIATTTAITSQTPNPSAPGQAVAMAFTVTAATTPAGTVTVTASTGETCSGSLSAGAGSCSMTFATAGARTITASYAGNGNHLASTSSPVTQNVNGPIASLTPASADFGVVYLDDKATRAFTLRNTGNAPLQLTNIAIAAPGNALTDFTKKPPACPASLAPGASCTINIQFDPKAIGVRTATLRVTDSGNRSPHTATMSATVVNPKANLAPGKVEFGKLKVGTVSVVKTVTLTNVGTTALTVGAISVTGDYAIAAGTTCAVGASLAPAASCKVNLTFRPSAKGDRNGSLTVTSDAKNSPHTVALSGGGS